MRIRAKDIVKLLPVLAVLCVVLVLQQALPKVSAGDDANFISTETREGRLAVFDDVWETIDERYYDPAFGGVNWEGLRTAYREEAAGARSGHELYQVLRRMVGSLKDPHTRVYSPAEKFDWWRPRFVSAGISVREIEGQPTVVYVVRDSAAERIGIRPGDVIESVDGIAATTLVKRKLGSDVDSSSHRSARMRAVASLMDGEPETIVSIKWRKRDGKTKSEKLTRYWDQRQPGYQISRDDKFVTLDLQAFTQLVAFEAARALKEKLRDSRGIILDLRNNGGGDADAMAAIAAIFLGDGLSLGRFTDRGGLSFELSTLSKLVMTADRFQTQLPLIVLVSERTSSAAEILAAALQKQGRAKLVGAETCGCVLAIRSRHNLPDDGVLDVSELDFRTREGMRLEGQGVRPDYSVPPQRLDFYDRRDRAAEFAVTLLKKSTTR
jgi:carboxyl-terminal processing protease